MWYVLKMAVSDPARPPVRRDGKLYQGSSLAEVLAEAAMDLAGAVEGLRGTAQHMLEGFMTGGFEMEVWTCSATYKEYGRAAEAFRQTMRRSALRAHSCGSSSLPLGTPTDNRGSLLN